MKIIDLISMKETNLPDSITLSCALGTFDGVHIGHAEILKAATADLRHDQKSAAWTFSRSPASYFGKSDGYLTTLEEKLYLFRKFGIEIAIIEDFENVCGVSADDFVSKILFENCRVRFAACGYNFTYGKNAAGNCQTLKNSMIRLGGDSITVGEVKFDGKAVSSSEIKKALAGGDIIAANGMLGRPYSITGEVIHGKHLGTEMGFPTANQSLKKGGAALKFGVYATICRIDGKDYYGVTNVGMRPSVDDGDAVNAETHLIGCDENLYGKTITTEFYGFLREEIKFENLSQLCNQIKADTKNSIDFFNKRRQK